MEMMEGGDDVDYEFDCPQFTNFDDDEDWGMSNNDGYFAERPSDIGLEVDVEWVKKLEGDQDNGNDAMASEDDENSLNRSNLSNFVASSTKKAEKRIKQGKEVVVDELCFPMTPPDVLQPKQGSGSGGRKQLSALSAKVVSMQQASSTPKKDEVETPKSTPGNENISSTPTFDAVAASPMSMSAAATPEILSTEKAPRTDDNKNDDATEEEEEEENAGYTQQQEQEQQQQQQEVLEQAPVIAENPPPAPTNILRRDPNKKREDKKEKVKPANSAVARMRLTEPKTPMFATSSRPKRQPILSSTTQELERLAKEKKERDALAARQKREVEAQAKQQFVKPAPKPLTKPKSPVLRSAARQKEEEQQQQMMEEEAKKKKKEEEKPHRMTASGPGPVKLTHPKPFAFATDQRAAQHPHPEQEEAKKSDNFVSMASQVHQFCHKTPKRFHYSKKLELPARDELKLTEPESPMLVSTSRHRDVDYIGSKQLEERAVRAAPQFKARPLNKRIMSSAGDLGVPKVEKKAPCVPKAFNFHTDQRISARRSSLINHGAASTGRRTPKPSGLRKSASATRRASTAVAHATDSDGRPKLTEPKPFNLSTDMRAKARPSSPLARAEVGSEPAPYQYRAKKMPDFSRPPKLAPTQKRRPVTPKPFQLASERRHELAQRQLQEKIQMEREKEEQARHFKAKPVTQYLSSSPNPKAEVLASRKPLTDPVTPMVLNRSLAKRNEMVIRQQQKEEAERHRHQFHARPLPVTTYEKGFSPKKAGTVCASPIGFNLRSEQRALQRAAFDQHMNEKMHQIELEKEMAKMREEEERERDLKEYRKSLSFKAKPVPDYNALVNDHAAAPAQERPKLTEPKSPYLRTKKRSQLHAEGGSVATADAFDKENIENNSEAGTITSV